MLHGAETGMTNASKKETTDRNRVLEVSDKELKNGKNKVYNS